MTNSTNINLMSLKPANKYGFAVADIRFNGNPKIYTFVRKAHLGSGLYERFLIINGCKIEFKVNPDRSYEAYNIEQVYETQDMFKKDTTKSAKSIYEKIKNDLGEEPKEELVAPVEDAPVEVVPEVVAEVVPGGEVRHEKYNDIKTCLEANIPVYLAGPAGSGKNHTVEQIAKELGWNFFFSNSIQQEFKLTGFIDAGGNYHETEFYKALSNDGDCIFFLDEMDASIPEVLVLLNAAIANGYFEFPTGRIDFDHVHFVAAGNTVGSGADEMYTGRMVIDQATLDRFAIIEFDYSVKIERHITKGNLDLINFIHSLREQAKDKGIRATFSYRCMTMMTKLERAGMDIVVAVEITILKGMDKDTINTFKTSGFNTKYDNALARIQRAA